MWGEGGGYRFEGKGGRLVLMVRGSYHLITSKV